jgi:hypothetical protein
MLFGIRRNYLLARIQLTLLLLLPCVLAGIWLRAAEGH